jgi:dsDNA-specific endonuclease/ATPase MutS2
MHEQAFEILEYNDLRALIRRGAQTPMGEARVSELKPLGNIATLKR